MTNANEAVFHNTLIRPNIGEFFGCFIFSFLTCFCGQNRNAGGFEYSILVAISLFISKRLVSSSCPTYFNPGVTIFQCFRKTVPPILAVSLIIVQLFGFLCGVTLFRALVTQTYFNDSIVLYEIVELDEIRQIDRIQAFVLEIILSMLFFLSHTSSNINDPLISISWGFIQFIAYPLFGFTSNLTFLLVISVTSFIFSPTTTPSLELLYLNVFSMLIAVLLAITAEGIMKPSTNIVTEQKNEDNLEDNRVA